MYSVKIIADSISPWNVRLTTIEFTQPRYAHSEFLTHSMIARNAASSRAIPVKELIRMVKEDPVIPQWWGKNQSGMVASNEELSESDKAQARAHWLELRDRAVEYAEKLIALGLHKQYVNRVLEPWMWITVVATATDWDNFFFQRTTDSGILPDRGFNPNFPAYPDFQKAVRLIKDTYDTSSPTLLESNDWHLPYTLPEERLSLPIETLIKVSVARCARVSYTRQGEIRDLEKDIERHDQLVESGHWSPLSHIAKSPTKKEFYTNPRSGNLFGWIQYRKIFKDENYFSTK